MNSNHETYEKWRKMLMHTCLMLACVVFGVEIIMFFALWGAKMIFQTIPVYMMRFLVIPSVFNAIIVYTGYCLVNSKKTGEIVKNYTPVVTLCILCFCIACVHNVFPATVCCFCLPVFITVIYAQNRMTRNITLLCVLFLMIAGVFAKLDGRSQDLYLFFDIGVAVIALFCTYLTTIVLIKYENEKKRIIRNSYRRQLHLQEQLLHDSLTGLYNHSAFYNLLANSLENMKTHKGTLFLVVIDIDDFKIVNDTWGHEQGNKVLKVLSTILKNSCPKQAYAARYGGEEFAIIFTDICFQEAHDTMEKIRNNISQHIFKSLNGHHVTISCGLTNYSKPISVTDFFQVADQAMYKAKTRGKNNTFYINQSTNNDDYIIN